MKNSLYKINKLQIDKDDFRLNINKFEVHRGAIYLISGRINSGKSVFLKALSNSIQYTGKIDYEGLDLQGFNRKLYMNEVLYVQTAPKNWKKAGDYINNFIKQYDAIKKSSKDVNSLIGKLGISKLLDVRLRNLSESERRLVGLIASIASDPKVLIIDDLDAYLTHNELKVLKGVLQRKANYDGVTIIGSCRYIYNFSKFASVNITLDSGRIVRVRS
tara:strand:- start:420 stop:1070 length:651 start_codon:yes stop_codon:yes gene_type:complete